MELQRRDLLRLAALGGSGLALSACGAGGTSPGPSPAALPAAATPAASTHATDAEGPTVFSNWPLYIDADDNGRSGTLGDFTAQTGIAVTYLEDINDGPEFYEKLRPDLEAGRSVGRDVLVFSEETARLMIKNGYCEPLDYSLIPSAGNLLPRFRSVSFDPDRVFTIPWQAGFTGLGWNTALLKERLGVASVTSMEQFFDPRLAGRVSILAETQDTMGLLLAWQGANPADFTDAEFDLALDVLQRHIDSGHIRQVTGNDYISGLDSGDLVAVMGWSGDVLALGDDYGFGLPESGGLLWADCMVIPAHAEHASSANRLIDFYYEPANAARVAASIQYVCPVEGAREVMATIDPSLADNAWIFPPADVLDGAFGTPDLTLERAVALDRLFDSVIGG